MATITIGPTNGVTQKFDVAYIGATLALNSTNFPWYTSDKVAGVYAKSGNRQGYNFTKPGAPIAGIAQLVQGITGSLVSVYELNLKAPITLDAAQFYVMGVSVSTVNQIPVANAGNDLAITLPSNSVAIMGQAADADTTDTLSYAWRQITGPNTAVGFPATTLNVVASNLVEGIYTFGFTATDQKGAASPEDRVMITVNPAAGAGGDTLLTPATSDRGRNTIQNGTPASPLGLRSALSYVDVSTSANRVRLSGFCNIPADKGVPQFAKGIAIRDAGNTVFSPATIYDGSNDERWVTLPGSGTRTIRVYEGPAIAINNDADVRGTYVTSIFCEGDPNALLVPPLAATTTGVAFVDSIGCGFYPADFATDSWEIYLESLLPNSQFYIDGAGGFSYGKHLGTPALRTAAAARAAVILNRNGVQKKLVYLARGINDSYGFGATSANMKLIITAFIAELKAQIPGVIILMETLKYEESGLNPQYNPSDSTTNYRQAIIDSIPAGTANVFLLDGLSFYKGSSFLYTDKIHPLANGQRAIGQGIYDELTRQGAFTPQVVNFPVVNGGVSTNNVITNTAGGDYNGCTAIGDIAIDMTGSNYYKGSLLIDGAVYKTSIIALLADTTLDAFHTTDAYLFNTDAQNSQGLTIPAGFNALGNYNGTQGFGFGGSYLEYNVGAVMRIDVFSSWLIYRVDATHFIVQQFVPNTDKLRVKVFVPAGGEARNIKMLGHTVPA